MISVSAPRRCSACSLKACRIRAIAGRLNITERTVEAHITKAFHQLGLVEDPTSHRRVLAVLAYLRHQGGAQ